MEEKMTLTHYSLFERDYRDIPHLSQREDRWS